MVTKNTKGQFSQEDIEFIGPNNNDFSDLLTEENELEKELQEAIELAEKETNKRIAETKTVNDPEPKPESQGKTVMQISAENMAKVYMKNLYRFCKIAGYVIGGTVFGIVIVLITSALTIRAIVKRITGK